MNRCARCRNCPVCVRIRKRTRNAQQRNSWQRRKIRAIDAGLCQRCMKRPQSDTSLMCVKCRDEHRDYQNQRNKSPEQKARLAAYMRAYRARLREERT